MRVRLILAFLSGAYVSLLVTNIAHLATVGCGAPPPSNAPKSKKKRELSNQHERQPQNYQTVELELHDGFFPTMENKLRSSCPPRLEFLHIPKTGGTTIEETATMQANIAWGSCHFHLNYRKPWKICPRKLITPTKSSSPSTKKWPKHKLLRNLWHYPLHWLENNHTITVRHIPSNPYHNLAARGNIPPASCSVVDQELRFFAVIRNPYERAISAYYYQAEFKHKKKLQYQKFMNKWIYKQCVEYRKYSNDPNIIGYENRSVFYIPQYEYIFDNHGRRRVQHILHFENLTHEFNELMNMYNLNISLLDTKTKSSVTVKEGERFGPKDLYPKVRSALGKLFVNDFALGNYSLNI